MSPPPPQPTTAPRCASLTDDLPLRGREADEELCLGVADVARVVDATGRDRDRVARPHLEVLVVDAVQDPALQDVQYLVAVGVVVRRVLLTGADEALADGQAVGVSHRAGDHPLEPAPRLGIDHAA